MSDAEYFATYGDRSLDLQVAGKLMGWTGFALWGGAPRGVDPARKVPGFIPRYSTDHSAAWEVWRECVKRFGHVEITADMEDYGRGPGDIVTVLMGIETGLSWRGTGPFPPTICKLALEADEAMARYEAGVQP